MTHAVTLTSKASLLQGLIFDEIISKRANQITAFRKGLSNFGLLELCQQHPCQTRKLFVSAKKDLDAEGFLELVNLSPELTGEQRKVRQWFTNYIHARHQEEVAGE